MSLQHSTTPNSSDASEPITKEEKYMKNLVMNYLVTAGFKETAEKFQAEANIEPSKMRAESALLRCEECEERNKSNASFETNLSDKLFYTPDELGKKLGLDKEVVEFLKREEFNKDACLMVVYSPDELGEKLGLDKEVVEFLKREDFNEDVRLMVVHFTPSMAGSKAEVYDALTQSGAVQILSNVYKYETSKDFYASQSECGKAVPWAFYTSLNNQVILNGHRISNIQMISTTIITAFIKRKFSIDSLQFFHI